MRVPDYVESLTGFRTWVMCPDGLVSPMMFEKRAWPIERPYVANCFLGEAFGEDNVQPHDSPDIKCSCGIHSFSSFPGSWSKWASNEGRIAKKLAGGTKSDISTFVPGLVHSWGHVVEGDNGRRAEFAYPRALGFSPLWDVKKQKLVNQMALMYGIEAVPIYELEELAKS